MATPSTGAQPTTPAKAQAPAKVQAPAPKILRVGIIQSGRIIEERLLRARHNVSVGQAARNTFVIPSPVLPRTYQLFQVTGDTYTVRFTDAMDGRVSIGGKVHTFLQIKQSGRAAKRGPFWNLILEQGARGKVVLGDVTVLFQFVTAPPVRPKARLPASIRGSITSGMDWLYSVIFIGSAGIHLLLAIVFLVIDKPKNVSGSRFKNLVRVEIKRKVENWQKKKTTDEGKDGVGAQADVGEMAGDMKEESRARGRGRKGPREDEGDGRKGPRIDKESEDAVVDAMMGQAVNADSAAQGFKSVAIGAKCVGAECRGARSGTDILSSGKAGTGLDGNASSFGGATGSGPAGPGGGTRGGGGRFRGGRGGVGRGISGPGGSGRPVRISRPAGPRPRVGASVPTPRIVNMTLAAKIKSRIASKARALKYLYNQRLQSGAKFKCRVQISFLLQKSGSVSSVGVSGGCPAGFISAVKSRVGTWRLPAGVTQFIRFTVSFSY